MTELTRGPSAPASASGTAWANRRAAASRWLLAGLFTWLAGLRRRRKLRGLSNRQLRDAGIDPTSAGRGRAADVTSDPSIGSGR